MTAIVSFPGRQIAAVWLRPPPGGPWNRLVCRRRGWRATGIRSLLCAVGDLAGGAEGTGLHQKTRLRRGRAGRTLATEAVCDNWAAQRYGRRADAPTAALLRQGVH